MKSDDPVIAKVAAADPARALARSEPEISELASRVRQRVLAAGDQATLGESGAGHNGERSRGLLHGFGTVAVCCTSIVVVVLVVGAFAVLGGSRQTHGQGSSGNGNPPAVSHQVQLERSQAQQLYAPVLVFKRSTTSAQRARVQSAPREDAKRINGCQAPYQKQLFEGFRIGSRRYKLYSLYEHGTLLEQYQSRVSVVAPQLTVLAQTWANMRLANRTMQTFAHGVAAEFFASLRAPKFDSCAFVKDIARHHFSLAWAQRSSYGIAATRFWNEISTAGNTTNAFWKWVQSTPVQRMHLFTKQQLQDLSNLPGEIS